jgi:folate-binding protein YgfZ
MRFEYDTGTVAEGRGRLVTAPPSNTNTETIQTMNSRWKAFLESKSAQVDAGGDVRFPDAPAAADCAICDLSRLGLIAVSGKDAADYLQGQLTNDVRELSDSHSQLSSHCSPKGRMLATFRVLRVEDTLFLQVPRPQLEKILKRLQMFVLRSQVRLSDASDDFTTIGVIGECAPDLLSGHFAAIPELANDVAREGELTLIRVGESPPRFAIIAPPAAAEPLWDSLEREATPVHAQYWSLLDIRSGIPSVHPETIDAFVPQMANMELIDGVSFAKGCYTGQEVVARMQYLGKLKRRMYLGEVTADTPPRPGDELYSPSSTSGQATGRVVDACAVGDRHYELLAVVEIAAAEAGDVSLGQDGPALTLKEPPYGFPSQG